MLRNKKVKTSLMMFVMVVVVLCMQVSAFANPTYTTKTTYDFTNNLVKATSTVSGLSGDEEVAFIAFEGNGAAPAADSDILYIDQAKVPAGTSAQSFEYSMPIGDGDFQLSAVGVSTVVKFGAEKSEAAAPEAALDASISYFTISFADAENGSISVNNSNTSPVYVGTAATTAGNLTAVVSSVTLTAEDGYKLESLTVNDEEVDLDDVVAGVYSLGVVAEDTVVAATFVEDGDQEDTNEVAIGAINFGGENLVVFGTVNCSNAQNFVECGIIISGTLSGEDLQLDENFNPLNGDAYKLPALGYGTNNAYAIEVVDEEGVFLTAESYNAITYLIYEDANGDEQVTYSN